LQGVREKREQERAARENPPISCERRSSACAAHAHPRALVADPMPSRARQMLIIPSAILGLAPMASSSSSHAAVQSVHAFSASRTSACLEKTRAQDRLRCGTRTLGYCTIQASVANHPTPTAGLLTTTPKPILSTLCRASRDGLRTVIATARGRGGGDGAYFVVYLVLRFLVGKRTGGECTV
jgi:hypothetical protein